MSFVISVKKSGILFKTCLIIPLKDVQISALTVYGQICAGFEEIFKDDNHVYQLGLNTNGNIELDQLSALDAASFSVSADGATFKDKNGTYTPDQACPAN